MHNLTELNTYSATSVNYVDQGTGSQVLANRYQINGVLDTSKNVFENIEKICSTSGSWLSYDIQQGLWGVVINKSETSIASFDDSNILGSVSISGTGLEDLYNSVNVEFPHRNLRDSADFVNIEIPSGDRNPNEPDNTLNISYDILNEPVQAQLLGFIELKQSRVDIVIRFETDYSYYGLSAGDVIAVTNAQFGFVSKPFRIISIAEIQNEQGPLTLSITALEYSASVYNESDLYRYTRTDSTGIITIGSIGIPGTPTVTKIEQDARPRITVSAVSPTGIVEGMEFWLTEDVSESDDADRSYTLISTQYPTGNNATFGSGTTVTFDYDNLEASDFLIKCRGFNTTTVGPFSDPSGLVNFDPVQITNAISTDTLAINSTGGLATALTAIELLSKVDGLFGPIGNAVANSSIFSQVFELFKEETGYDIVGQTEAGNLVVAANVAILNEGNTLTTTVGSINFVGNGIQATGSGSNVTVTIPAAGYLYDLGDVQLNSPTNGQTLTFSSSANRWVNASPGDVTPPGVLYPRPATSENAVVLDALSGSGASIIRALGSALTGAPGDGRADFIGNTNTAVDARPPYRDYRVDPTSGNIHVVPTTGSLYFAASGRVGWNPKSASAESTTVDYWEGDFRPVISPITKGGGSIYLYKSDGTLVETIGSSSFNIVNQIILEVPFGNRLANSDYYVKFDPDSVKYCNSTSNVCVISSSDVRTTYTTAEGNQVSQLPPLNNFYGPIGSTPPLYNSVWPFSTGNSNISAYGSPPSISLPVSSLGNYPIAAQSIPLSERSLKVVGSTPAQNSTANVGNINISATFNGPTVHVVNSGRTGNITIVATNLANSIVSTQTLTPTTTVGNTINYGSLTTSANLSYTVSIQSPQIYVSSGIVVPYTDPLCANSSSSITYTSSLNVPQTIFRFNTITPGPTGFLQSYNLVGTSLSAVKILSRIVLNFTGFAYPTTGNIEIYKASDDSLVQSIAVDEIYTPPNNVPDRGILPSADNSYGLFLSNTSWSGGLSYIINLTSGFEPSTSYYMLIDAGAFEKDDSPTWPGVTDKTLITWTTTTD